MTGDVVQAITLTLTFLSLPVLFPEHPLDTTVPAALSY
jgi:hypothetical protein